jgi:hypothetical protein
MKQFSAGKLVAREQTKRSGSERYVDNLSLTIVPVLSLATEDYPYRNIPLEGLALHILLFCHHENYHPVGRVSHFF